MEATDRRAFPALNGFLAPRETEKERKTSKRQGALTERKRESSITEREREDRDDSEERWKDGKMERWKDNTEKEKRREG
jgi:hypothetical protein